MGGPYYHVGMRRAAGLLLHPTSLPGPGGIGDLGPEAEAFVGWMHRAGFGVWQVLPLGPTGHHGSPYSALSSFAGNPLLVSPRRLVDEGLLDPAALDRTPVFPEDRVAFRAVNRWKRGLLRRSWARFKASAPEEARRDLERFRDDSLQRGWLADWALYAALRARNRRAVWSSWAPELRRREPSALDRARQQLGEGMRFFEYEQFLFFRQWATMREAARQFGIRVLGDLPIYPSHDSADVWAHQELFQLDGHGLPTRVAGVPPDYFSQDGQLWHQPLYRWDVMEQRGFAWWIARARFQLALHDLLRLDHFRGFVACWEVPAGARTAAGGRWVPGPGARLFGALQAALGALPFVAEDLGVITPDVRELRRELGLPGMKVLQFAFDGPDSDHLPRHHEPDSVAYTGTHDNDTLRGWFEGLSPALQGHVLELLRCGPEEVVPRLIRTAYGSIAGLAIVPLQDVLGLGREARMNTPGRAAGNWAWRARPGALTDELAAELRALAAETDRLPA